MAGSLVFLFVLTLGYCDQIHHDMTNEEILSTFRVPRENVPEHEVVSVLHKIDEKDKKASSIVKVRTSSRDIELYLQPNEGILASVNTPVWIVRPDEAKAGGLHYQKIESTVLEKFRDYRPYHDYSTNSAVVLRMHKNQSIDMTGTIMENLVIVPLPVSVDSKLPEVKKSVDETNSKDHGFTEINRHVIYNQSDINSIGFSKTTKITGRNPFLKNHSTRRRTKTYINRDNTQYPPIIYPELLAVLDYSLYKSLNSNITESLLYLLSFWNAVDLRYRILDNPAIRLNIAAMIISEERGGIPYLENYRMDDLLDADLALKSMSHFFYMEGNSGYRFRFEHYDFAVSLTKLDLCNMEDDGTCNRNTLGYAYEWGACNRSNVDENTEAVGIVEDNGGYSGLIPATHEVAHLLGASHDGDNGDTDPLCSRDERNIMSRMYAPESFGENNFYWSNCSIKQFREFFRSDDSICLRDNPYEKRKGDQLARILPGTVQSLDDQCAKVCRGRAYTPDDNVCIALKCFDSAGYACPVVAAAAEGSFCGYEKRCLSGRCLSHNEKILPEQRSRTQPNRFFHNYVTNENFDKK